jgi:hypothetical protein
MLTFKVRGSRKYSIQLRPHKFHNYHNMYLNLRGSGHKSAHQYNTPLILESKYPLLSKTTSAEANYPWSAQASSPELIIPNTPP